MAEPGAIAALQPAPAQTPTHSAPEEPADTVANATGEFDWHAQSASALADIDRAVDRILEADRESHRPRARVTELATRSKEEGARQLTRASSAVRSRWKLVIVGVTVVAVALVGALTAESLPSHPQASGPVLSEAMVSSTPASGAGNNASEPRAASPETPSSQAESSARASRQSTGAATGDDPRAAALALLEERDHCLSGGSAACLAHVDQFQSPLLASDQLQFARGHRVGNQSTPEPVAGAAPLPSVEVVQRTGAAALVSVDPWHGNESQPAGPAPAAHSKPASLLLVKGEAGWRLREVFLADPVDGRRRTGISQ
ncbi:hypothetical protein [Subtercola frigoramans]|uniref:Uncharacterized protein n=1 Tax=Subtercola frigoramans TaxID=120298 RepID=A0ABS2L5S5_9MICO|nr:hypothetical protein [Subtercola frigoramans]MBM7472085.1 hypothetical protein [Subtercola frigoramans]